MQQGQATDKYGISTIPGWTLVYRPPPPGASLGQNDVHYIESGTPWALGPHWVKMMYII